LPKEVIMKHVQRLTLDGNLITITYNYREAWQRILNGHMLPPVVIKMNPKVNIERKRLIEQFNMVAPDLMFIVREYLSTVKEKFEGISFEYQFVNHAIRLDENKKGIEYYRAELKWYYND